MTFTAIDWGTTEFRLAVVDAPSMTARHELRRPAGVAHHGLSAAAAAEHCARFLAGVLAELPTAYAGAPVVVSGMASSALGLRELPYARLPLDPAAPDLRSAWVPLPGGRRVLLISGLRGPEDVMRGEEVQALGLADWLRAGAGGGPATLLLPGTHCKHLTFDGRRYTAFRTYLTGERFALLAERSLLRHAVRPGPLDATARAAFAAGVGEGAAGRLAERLFGLRARQLDGRGSPVDRYHYLSGLLIGEELRELAADGGPVFLAAAGPLAEAYGLALEQLLGPERVHRTTADELERATRRAQGRLLAAATE